MQGVLARLTFGSGDIRKWIGNHGDIEIPASVEAGCFKRCNVEKLSFSGETEFFVEGPLLIAKKSMYLVCPFKELREIEIPATVDEVSARRNCHF